MPRMIVIAGPPGGGKSTAFGREYFGEKGIHYFNIDDRCKELNGGSFVGIPADLRRAVNIELYDWALYRLRRGETFAFETTLRNRSVIDQCGAAHDAAFHTELHFLATSEDLHWDRVRARAMDGGHGASESSIRRMYRDSLDNLPAALQTFDHSYLYDTTSDPDLYVEVHEKRLTVCQTPVSWMRSALLRSSLREDPTGL